MAISAYLSIVTLNLGGLNSLIKGHRMADWVNKNQQDSSMYIAYRRLSSHLNKNTDWKDKDG